MKNKVGIADIEKFQNAGKDNKPCEDCFGKGYIYLGSFKLTNNGLPVFRKCKYCSGKGFITMTEQEIYELLETELESAFEERE